MQFIAISGSLRKGSFNTRLARALAELAPDGVEIEVATLDGIPLYDGDVEETDGIPEAVENLRGKIKASDGIILVTPEYNAGIPGVFKNAIDWLTRPPKEIRPTFRDRPLGLGGATPGGGGTILAQAAWLVVLRQLGVRLFPDHLRISSASEQFRDGHLSSEEVGQRIRKWTANFAQFVGDRSSRSR